MISLNFRTLALCLSLVGCGGGGDAAPTSSEPLQTCTPQVVSIQLAGDSTQFGFDGATQATAAQPPGVVLQASMDARFGRGAVMVEDIGVPGTTLFDLPPSKLTADITVVNFGINDQIVMPIEVYKAKLRALRPSVFETPNPTERADHPLTASYAQAMREVAAETGAPVADVMPYVLARPNWQVDIADQIHPNNALYGAIVTDVLTPAVAPLVAKLRCQ